MILATLTTAAPDGIAAETKLLLDDPFWSEQLVSALERLPIARDQEGDGHSIEILSFSIESREDEEGLTLNSRIVARSAEDGTPVSWLLAGMGLHQSLKAAAERSEGSLSSLLERLCSSESFHSSGTLFQKHECGGFQEFRCFSGSDSPGNGAKCEIRLSATP